MNKTKIEWADYTINPVKGLCPMACPVCFITCSMVNVIREVHYASNRRN